MKSPIRKGLRTKSVLQRELLSERDCPAELRQAIVRSCKQLRLQTERDRQLVEQTLRLRFFYGGCRVAYLDSARGIEIVASAAGAEEFKRVFRALRGLKPIERERLIIDIPEPWKTEGHARIPSPLVARAD